MKNKSQKPELNVPIVCGSFYWVRAFQDSDFEPAKCKDRYGSGKLYFCFTDGSVMEVGSVWEVKELNCV